MLFDVVQEMKTSARLLFAYLLAMSGFVSAMPKDLPAEQLVAQSEQILVDYRAWLAEKPRKVAIRFLDKEELPKPVAKLGFKSAAIEEGLVILLSSDEDGEIIEAIAVTTDGKDRNALLKDFGWQVSDSSDPRIKLLKRRNAQQDAP